MPNHHMLMVAAVVCFALDVVLPLMGVGGKINLMALGLMLWAVTQL